MNKQFFDETRDQSIIKSGIVSKYFWEWAKVILPSVKRRNGKMAYIDLFAGPGRYADGSISTPLMVLTLALYRIILKKGRLYPTTTYTNFNE